MSFPFLFSDGAAADSILLTGFHSLWLSVFGLMIVRVRRLRTPAVQSAWCIFFIVLLLFLPFITWFIPRPVSRAHIDQATPITTISAVPEVGAPLLNSFLNVHSVTTKPNMKLWEIGIDRLGLLWLVVTLVCVGRLIYGLRFLRSYCNCLREVSDRRLCFILRGINETFHFRRKPRFLVSLTLPSPVSIGILKPAVILPAGLYQSASDEELQAILMHELAHIHNFDHVLGLLERLVKALYWWNPFVYRICDTLTTAREEVSDKYAISAMGSATSYATLLVRLLEQVPRISRMPCVAGMAAPYECLQTRIWNIVSRKRDLRVKAGKRIIIAISATAVLMCGLIGLGSQVRIFGRERESIPEKARLSEAATEARQAVDMPSLRSTAPVSEAPRGPASTFVKAGKGTKTITAATPGETSVPSIGSTILARSDAFPTMRNEKSDAPQTALVQLDEFHRPVVRSRVEPQIATRALRARLTTTVRVAVVVNEKGDVYEARIRNGHPLLDVSVLNAVIQWKFKPLSVEGEPRAFVTTIDLYLKPE
jgi:TonB family protein